MPLGGQHSGADTEHCVEDGTNGANGRRAFSFTGKTLYGSTGGSGSSGAWLAYFPEEKLALAYATNGKIYPVADIVRLVFDIYWKEPVQIPTFDAVEVRSELLQQYASSLVASPAMLAGIVAGVALLLVAIGTYGVFAYTIAQGRREIAIRMALGAQTRQIRTQFLSMGLRFLVAGILLGVLGVWVAGKAMQSVLFGVPPLHLAILFATLLVLTAVSLVACLIPARRASTL